MKKQTNLQRCHAEQKPASVGGGDIGDPPAPESQQFQLSKLDEFHHCSVAIMDAMRCLGDALSSQDTGGGGRVDCGSLQLRREVFAVQVRFAPSPGFLAVFSEGTRVTHTDCMLVAQVGHGTSVTRTHAAKHAATPAQVNTTCASARRCCTAQTDTTETQARHTDVPATVMLASEKQAWHDGVVTASTHIRGGVRDPRFFLSVVCVSIRRR